MEIKPSHRRRARRMVLQAMYQWVISQNPLTDIEAEFHANEDIHKIDQEYFHELLHEIPKNLATVDDLFRPYLSVPFEELDPIELCVMRIATYELHYRIDVPYKVVINEALNLTKSFGSVEGYKFVNAVMDKVARNERQDEMGG